MIAAIKPPRLRAGSKVVVIDLSGDDPRTNAGSYAAALSTLREGLGLVVDDDSAAGGVQSPAERAEAIHAALRDDDIGGVFVTATGTDAIRVLPHLDLDLVAAHPKVLVGFAEATVLLLAWARAGVTAFHGPLLLDGLAQAAALGESFLGQLRAVLFDGDAHQYSRFEWWSRDYVRGPQGATTEVDTKYAADPNVRVLQGSGVVTAPVLGGSLGGLIALAGTRVFQPAEDLSGRWLLLAGSRDRPGAASFETALWGLGARGGLENIAGILLGRLGGYIPPHLAAIDEVLARIASDYCKPDLPIVTGVDVGYTTPQFVLPLGVPLSVDLDKFTLSLAEPAVA